MRERTTELQKSSHMMLDQIISACDRVVLSLLQLGEKIALYSYWMKFCKTPVLLYSTR
jgi:hypothetical protein